LETQVLENSINLQ